MELFGYVQNARRSKVLNRLYYSQENHEFLSSGGIMIRVYVADNVMLD
jgi:hypothetical protein